jgi:hypothetical protein
MARAHTTSSAQDTLAKAIADDLLKLASITKEHAVTDLKDLDSQISSSLLLLPSTYTHKGGTLVLNKKLLKAGEPGKAILARLGDNLEQYLCSPPMGLEKGYHSVKVIFQDGRLSCTVRDIHENPIADIKNYDPLHTGPKKIAELLDAACQEKSGDLCEKMNGREDLRVIVARYVAGNISPAQEPDKVVTFALTQSQGRRGERLQIQNSHGHAVATINVAMLLEKEAGMKAKFPGYLTAHCDEFVTPHSKYADFKGKKNLSKHVASESDLRAAEGAIAIISDNLPRPKKKKSGDTALTYTVLPSCIADAPGISAWLVITQGPRELCAQTPPLTVPLTIDQLHRLATDRTPRALFGLCSEHLSGHILAATVFEELVESAPKHRVQASDLRTLSSGTSQLEEMEEAAAAAPPYMTLADLEEESRHPTSSTDDLDREDDEVPSHPAAAASPQAGRKTAAAGSVGHSTTPPKSSAPPSTPSTAGSPSVAATAVSGSGVAPTRHASTTGTPTTAATASSPALATGGSPKADAGPVPRPTAAPRPAGPASSTQSPAGGGSVKARPPITPRSSSGTVSTGSPSGDAGSATPGSQATASPAPEAAPDTRLVTQPASPSPAQRMAKLAAAGGAGANVALVRAFDTKPGPGPGQG